MKGQEEGLDKRDPALSGIESTRTRYKASKKKKKKRNKLSAGTQLPCIPLLAKIRSWDLSLGRDEIKVEMLQEEI